MPGVVGILTARRHHDESRPRPTSAAADCREPGYVGAPVHARWPPKSETHRAGRDRQGPASTGKPLPFHVDPLAEPASRTGPTRAPTTNVGAAEHRSSQKIKWTRADFDSRGHDPDAAWASPAPEWAYGEVDANVRASCKLVIDETLRARQQLAPQHGAAHARWRTGRTASASLHLSTQSHTWIVATARRASSASRHRRPGHRRGILRRRLRLQGKRLCDAGAAGA